MVDDFKTEYQPFYNLKIASAPMLIKKRNMKLLTISQLPLGIKKIALRFPLKVLLVFLASVVAIMLLASSYTNHLQEMLLQKVLIFCNLAFVLSLVTDLYSESKNFSVARSWGLKILAFLLCIIILFFYNPDQRQSDYYVVLCFALAFHLMVSFAAFWKQDSLDDFWHFNKILFLRILTGLLYSGAIILGLFLALAAIDNLFGINIYERIYYETFATVGIGFNSLFFLAGIPKVGAEKSISHNYPKGLKIFTQYVLIPLITLYLAILFLYALKILFQWQLPKGYVSTMILAYATFGILSLLLIYPIRAEEENNWIRWFSKWFYIMMIPLLLLLIIAVWVRTASYGITEQRYILIALGLWISGITLYTLLNKNNNIKVVPMSLAAVALIAAVGPQSVASISKWSQLKRLKIYYPVTNEKDNEEALSIVDYLVSNHGLQSLQSFTRVDLKKKDDAMKRDEESSVYYYREQKTDTALAILNLRKASIGNQIVFYKENEALINTENYPYLVYLQEYRDYIDLQLAGDSVFIRRNDNFDFSLEVQNKASVRIAFDTLINRLNDEFASNVNEEDKMYLSQDKLSLSVEHEVIDVKLVITQISKWESGPSRANSFQGYLLLRPK